MRKALTLARKGMGRTSPNPAVGAVLVKGGKILALDYHRRAGEPHAEALVLAKAGSRARGSTLYVTLEPCCHIEKRTPPCTKAVISAGIKRVVVAVKDPNPKVSGKGVRQLRRNGIDVSVGVMEQEARDINDAYAKYITTGLPLVTLKAAMTLDGKIATPKGQSKWITGEFARREVHRMRGRSDAIMTAVGTVLADDPELTSRERGGMTPLRVVIDPDLKSPAKSRIFETPPDTLVATRASDRRINNFIKSSIMIYKYKGKLELKKFLRHLAKRGVTSVLMEGGSSLNGHALMEGVVDKVAFFIAPKLIGGKDSYPVVGGRDFLALEKALKVNRIEVKRFGEDILVRGYIRDPWA